MQSGLSRRNAIACFSFLFLLVVLSHFFFSSASIADDFVYLKNLRNARLLAENSEWDAAIEWYKRAIAEDPKGADALKELASIYIAKKKDVPSGCALIEKLKSIIPKDPLVQSLSSFCEKVAAHAAEREAFLAENTPPTISSGVLETPPPPVRQALPLFSEINERYNEKDYDGALQAVEKALQTYPENTSFLILKAKIYVGMRKIPDAKEVLGRIEDQGTDSIVYTFALTDLAYIYDELDESQKALSLLQAGIAKGSEGAMINALIHFCERHRNNKEANELLYATLRSCTTCADILVTSSHSAAQSGDIENAVRLLNYALMAEPSNHSILFWLGHYHIQLKNLDEAIQAYEKGLSLHEGDVTVYYNLGYAYNTKKNYEKSSINYERAIELDPTLAQAHLNLGNAYIGLKNWKKAESAFKQSLQLDPSLYNAYYGLSLVARGRGDRQSEMWYLQKFYEMKGRYSKP